MGNSGDGSGMNCQSSGMGANPYFPVWDPVVSLNQPDSFGASSVVSQAEFTNSHYPVMMENQGISGSSHLVHYPSDSSYVDLVPKFPSYGSGSFSEMVSSFGLTDCGQFTNAGCNPNYTSNAAANNEKTISCSALSQDDHQLSEEPVTRISPDGKRRKRASESDSPCDPNKKGEEDKYKDPSGHSSGEHDEKKPRTEQHNEDANLRGKPSGKQAKDSSHSVEAPKENYIHVRARRGQATNSHSLAERVRREKISERMRLLQELVPGCNKITGKAVMLDEIINYVQSLQQQVEFLSMKLATVNPELNIDIERLLSKDILHTRGGSAAMMGLNPGMNPNPYSHGIYQPNIPVIPHTNPQVPRTLADSNLQNLLQMGFDPNSAIGNWAPNGLLKPDL